MAKIIHREKQSANKIFDNRCLKDDFKTLTPYLKEGMRVLDVGCGTGAISKDIAKLVGASGKVIGIDHTEGFIESGKESYQDVKNLELIHTDLFSFNPNEKFDLVISARVLQWLDNPEEALIKMKSLLKDGGLLSILDYNHEAIEWSPAPPESMLHFYNTFLKWRKEANLRNRIAEELKDFFEKIQLKNINVLNADEHYTKSNALFLEKVGIWSKVAGSTQMVDEGYLVDSDRLLAIQQYDDWVKHEAVSMTMKLNNVIGVK
jgi:ubiquinone/menaquinone biosynthesis C-methylase UbiE